MKSTSFFLMGLGTGAALAMLYSPKTGADNREDVFQGFGEGFGTSGWSLSTGDQIEIQILNPQTRKGPAIFTLTVGP